MRGTGKAIAVGVLGALVGVLSGCGSFAPGKDAENAYARVEAIDPLKLPPTLRDESTANTPLSIPDSTLLPIVRGARFQRDGQVFWLELGSRPEVVWAPLQKFLSTYQYEIINKDDLSGLIETAWRDVANPSTGARSTMDSVGQMLGMGGGINEKEKFIFRLERAANGGARLFASHRRLAESGSLALSQPGDPQLAAAMLSRFLVYLGFSRPVSLSMLHEIVNTPSSAVSMVQGDEALLVQRPLPLAWPRVEQAVLELGFEIWGQDRSAGKLGIRPQAILPPGVEQTGVLALSGVVGGKRPRYILQFSAAGETASAVQLASAEAGIEISGEVRRAFYEALQPRIG